MSGLFANGVHGGEDKSKTAGRILGKRILGFLSVILGKYYHYLLVQHRFVTILRGQSKLMAVLNIH